MPFWSGSNGVLALLLQFGGDVLFERLRDLSKMWRRAIALKSTTSSFCMQFPASAGFDRVSDFRGCGTVNDVSVETSLVLPVQKIVVDDQSS